MLLGTTQDTRDVHVYATKHFAQTMILQPVCDSLRTHTGQVYVDDGRIVCLAITPF